jgi:3-(methylthio)propanoyl-CoA dehydrogenase
MPIYKAPVEDVTFLLNDVFQIDRYDNLPGFTDASADMREAIIGEAAKLSEEVLQPLNRTGDLEGCKRHDDGSVTTPKGFKEAFKQVAEGGWLGLSAPAEYGGQGLPVTLSQVVTEFQSAANMAFSMYGGLTMGATAALMVHGKPEQKKMFVPKMVAGEWTGTMNLTEPQCGTDLGLLRTKAVKQADGSYKITGTKIFISAGEHDLADNIVHLVLARIEGAPEGTRGISLFIVPKFLVGADGKPGKRNDLRCVSLEHKLGIHASPTCVMSFGDDGGAVGYLVGEEGRGLSYMFTMMNNARLSVGIQGLAIAERAYQQASAFAKTRVQSKDDGSAQPQPVSIIQHPDRAAARKIQDRVDLLIPIVKAWFTDLGNEIASTGVQIHGGMGFIEETGAAQHLRDARILPIYEGTNGIQARDLVGRKVAKDGGETMMALVAEMRATAEELKTAPGDDLAAIRTALQAAADALEDATKWVAQSVKADLIAALAGSVPFLRLAGTALGGWLLARSAHAAQAKLATRDGDPAFLEAKVVTARFYAEVILPPALAQLGPLKAAGRTVFALSEAQL